MTTASSNSGKSRTTVHFNSKLENRLLGYITAAGAASVGLMAIAQPASAKIIYTPMDNVPISSLTTIDLNGDGIPDLNFYLWNTYHGAFQFVSGAPGNEIAFGTVNHSSGALPLPWLNRIGWKTKFTIGEGLITGVDGCHSYCFDIGPWQHQTDKYLGIKFQIGGKTHFGWMRLTVGDALTGTASGYAYEDQADEPIVAGKTSGPEAARNIAPAPLPVQPFQSLGMLARGADAVAIWRKEEEVIGS
jgi:hypothetical protein